MRRDRVYCFRDRESLRGASDFTINVSRDLLTCPLELIGQRDSATASSTTSSHFTQWLASEMPHISISLFKCPRSPFNARLLSVKVDVYRPSALPSSQKRTSSTEPSFSLPPRRRRASAANRLPATVLIIKLFHIWKRFDGDVKMWLKYVLKSL